MQILAYFEAFADVFQLWPLIRLRTHVTRLEPLHVRVGLAAPSGGTDSTQHSRGSGIADGGGGSSSNGGSCAHTPPAGWCVHSEPVLLDSGGDTRPTSDGGSDDAPPQTASADGHTNGHQSNGAGADAAKAGGGMRAVEFDAVVSCVGNYRWEMRLCLHPALTSTP